MDRALAGLPPVVRFLVRWLRPRPSALASAACWRYSLGEALWLARHGHADVWSATRPSTWGADRARPGPRAGRGHHRDGRLPGPPRPDRPGRPGPPGPGRHRRRRLAAHRPVHLGVRRSPIHTPAEATDLAQQIARRDSRPAGRADALRRPDRRAARRLRRRPGWSSRLPRPSSVRRRAAVLAAVQPYAELEFVNGGGTGSLHLTSVRRPADASSPAAPVCTARRCSTPTAPSPHVRRCTSSPPSSAARRRCTPRCSPAGTSPRGRPAGPGCRRRSGRARLSLLKSEAAGEVQTPLGRRSRRPAADRGPGLVPARQGGRGV